MCIPVVMLLGLTGGELGIGVCLAEPLQGGGNAMGATVRSSVVIGRPVSQVYSYVLDLPSNGPEWAPDLESVQKATEGPIGAGTRFEQLQKVMGRSRTTYLTFTDVDPERRIDAAAELGPMSPTASLSFEQADDGTRVSVAGEGNPKGAFKLLTPIFARVGQRMWDARLARLKQVLERSGSS